LNCLPAFCFALDDTVEIHSEEDLPEDSPFLEAVKQMKEKKYDNIVDLCTQQIEKGLWSIPVLLNEFFFFFFSVILQSFLNLIIVASPLSIAFYHS